MEKFADRIERLLQEKFFLYKKLQNVLEKEKTYVVDMDVDSLWVTISEKKTLASSIECIRQKIICLFDEIYSGLNMKDRPFNLSYVIKVLNVSSEKKAEFKKINLAINTCKKEITRAASDNKSFINESLAIMDGIFSTIMDTADKNGYNNSGAVLKKDGKNRLINAEV